MKRLIAIILPLCALLALPPFAARGQDATEETQLIAALQNGDSVQAKSDACARLKWIGTARSVPALAALLTDAQLSHSARYALESMKDPAAGQALRDALSKTTGSNQVGIIYSLAVRNETAAVPDLAQWLGNSDADVAKAAAAALGRIGGTEATSELQTAWEGTAPDAAHRAQCDGLLACGNSFLTHGEGRQAVKIFQELYDREKNDGIRLAAFRGLILSSEKQGIVLMVKAITEETGPSQGAALQLASFVGGPATTRALAKLLPDLSVSGQIALLQALQERGDRLAALPVGAMMDSKDRDVRLAAITAIGDLGDEIEAVPLAQHAASATGAEKAAARQSLTDLRHGRVGDMLLKALPVSKPEVQAELIRALAARGETFAAPKLLEMAQTDDDSIRAAALQGLAVLAGPPQVPGLIDLIVKSTNDDARSEVADSLSAACQHIEAQGAKVDSSALAQAVQSAPREAREALLGVCSGVTDPRIREVLRAAIADQDQGVRAAAIRALCESQDEELLPDVLKVASEEKASNFRMLGIRGCVRLITQDQSEAVPVSQKIDAMKSVLQIAFNAEGKRLVLSGLATIPDLQALNMAESLLGDADVKVEADDAIVQIARSLAARHPAQAAAALHKVLASGPDASTRKSAQAALRKIKVVD